MVGVLTAVRDLGRLREISAVLVRHGFGEIVARAGFGRTKKSRPSLGRAGDSERGARAGRGREEADLAGRARAARAPGPRPFVHQARPDRLHARRRPPGRAHHRAEEAPGRRPRRPASRRSRRSSRRASARRSRDVYVSFEEKPLATASIGQVHRAVLATPEGNVDVVVKVQRPGVGITVARDLELLHMMAAAIERAIPETKIYSPVGLVQAVRPLDHERAQLPHRGRQRRALRPELRGQSVRSLPEGLPPGVEPSTSSRSSSSTARRSTRALASGASRASRSPRAPSGSSSR